MTIETKFNIGDEVWFMYENRPMSMRVMHIELYISCNKVKRQYIDKYGSYRVSEHKLFRTKQELLDSL